MIKITVFSTLTGEYYMWDCMNNEKVIINAEFGKKVEAGGNLGKTIDIFKSELEKIIAVEETEIEKVKKELVELIIKHDYKLTGCRVIEKSQELDKLIVEEQNKLKWMLDKVKFIRRYKNIKRSTNDTKMTCI